MEKYLVHVLSCATSIKDEAIVTESESVNPILRHEIILKLAYHIMNSRNMDFSTKLLDDDVLKAAIEKTCQVNIQDVDFGMFFIYNSTLGSIGFTIHAKNLDDINFNTILDHVLLIFKTNLDGFGKKFTEHRLRKDVYDQSLIKLYTASEESKTPN